ncbi:MAG: AAA family ATPase [Phormidium sp. PBR-2020]|nr:MAG: AAA family ATPase [Phormidium sp. PBR-2020]
MDKLRQLKLDGFKSIKCLDLELSSLNILIGANGSGKSNLISFFKMLNEMMAGRLQQHIGISGRATSLLHFGAKITPQIQATLEFEVGGGVNQYQIRLCHASGDTLIFAKECLRFLESGSGKEKVDDLGSGHQETKIHQAVEDGKLTAKAIQDLLTRCRVYHFHDTSATANVRQSCYIGDNRWLMPDAGNLAAMLHRFREEEGVYYRRIVDTVRLIAPFFEDFVLEADASNRLMLNWQSKDSDRPFGPHQFSDGTLRSICLITLLLQPESELPKLMIVDEPELGLHPYALRIIADLFGSVSLHTQVIVSSQSSPFLDYFETEDIITVDIAEKASQFRRLKSEELEPWLEDYSLGEVWQKNVIAGGPH